MNPEKKEPLLRIIIKEFRNLLGKSSHVFLLRKARTLGDQRANLEGQFFQGSKLGIEDNLFPVFFFFDSQSYFFLIGFELKEIFLTVLSPNVSKVKGTLFYKVDIFLVDAPLEGDCLDME